MLFKVLFILLCFVVIFGCLNAEPNKQKQLLNSSSSSLSSAESEQFNPHDKGHHKNRGVVKQNVENKNIKKMGRLLNEKKPAHNSGQTSRQRHKTSSSKRLMPENEHIGTSNRQSVMQTNHQTELRAEQQRLSSANILAERSGVNRSTEQQRQTTQPHKNLEQQRQTTQPHKNLEQQRQTTQPHKNLEQQRQTTQRHETHRAEQRRPTEATDDCAVCLESLLGHEAADLKTLKSCKHSFHKKCIGEWLTNIKNDSCPVCRKKVLMEELPTKRFDPDQVQRNENLNVIDELPFEIVLELLQGQEAGGALPLQIPSHIVEAIQREHRNNLPSTSNAVSTRNEVWEPHEHLLNAVSTRNDEWESYEHLLNEQSGQQNHGQNETNQTASAVDLARDIGVTAVRGLARAATALGTSLNDWLNRTENYGSTSQSSVPPDQPQPGDIVRLRDQNGRVHTAQIVPKQQH